MKKMWKEKSLSHCYANFKDNILELTEYRKSEKIPYLIYAEVESLIKRKR